MDEEIAIAISEQNRLQHLIDESENEITVLQTIFLEQKRIYEAEIDTLADKRAQLRDHQIDAKRAVDEKIAAAELRYNSKNFHCVRLRAHLRPSLFLNPV
jgi:hypothetical protein